MSDTTLRSFLVSLGWKSDEAQQRKFVNAIEGATLKAKLLGDAIEEMARKVGLSVLSVAEGFEQLYYHAERTGASAKHLQAFEYAISQVGGSASAAGASFEAMAAKLRENPGNIAYLNKMGVELDANTGKLRFNAELAAKYSGEMKIYTAEQYRALTGMDENTFLAIRNHIGEITRFMAEREKAMKQSGFDPDQAAADAVKFNQVWRDLFMRLGVIGDKFYDDLEKDLTGPLQSLDKFLNEHQPEITKALDGLADAFGKTFKEGAEVFEQWAASPEAGKDIHQFFDDASTAANVFSSVLHGIVESLKWLAKINEESKSWAITRFLNWTQKPRDPSSQTESAVDDAWISTNSLSTGGTGEVKVNGQKVDSSNPMPVTFGKQDQLDAEGGGLWGWVKKKLGFGGGSSGANVGDAASRGGGGPISAGKPGNLTANQKEAYAAAIAEGLSPKAARSVVANLSGENLGNPSRVYADPSNHNPNQKAHGIAAWDTYRSDRIKKKFGKYPQEMSVADQTKAWIWEQRTFHPGTERAWKGDNEGDMIWQQVLSENPGNKGAALADRKGRFSRLGNLEKYRVGAAAFNASPPPVGASSNSTVNHNNMSQNVKIHVDGVGDPNAVAAAVASRVDRTATDLAGNFKGATQ